MQNAFTIDLEDWFCSSIKTNGIDASSWNNYELRLIEPTFLLLDLLKRKNIKATFFILGWIAEKVPDLIIEIAKNNHEIACHSYNHRLITSMTALEFEKDIDKALNILTKITNTDINGFRAPVFTITKRTLWALDILEKYGFKYDSSIYPTFFHPDYGINDAPLLPFQINGILEVPLSCHRVMGYSFPISGGGYFRLYPYNFTKSLIKKLNSANRPYIFYIHPWELDTNQPKMDLNLWGKFRHYQNLNGTRAKIENLLNDFSFTSIQNLIKNYNAK